MNKNMIEEAPPDVKRRRLSAANGYPQGVTYLNDLPSGILAHAASFLVAPSKALFAIALDSDEDSATSQNDRSSAIVGDRWKELDFGKIEKELAAKLTDSDIERVLLCIEALNKLKRLKLTNCTKITGTCLEPLRGSAVIDQIDLSLVGNENLDPQPPISCRIVLPILDSIIEREGCALKHLQFPSTWRKEPSTNSEFHEFLVRYNEMRDNREEVHCLECNRSRPDPRSDQWITTAIVSRYYGTHSNTCYGCLKHYCHDCDDDWLNGQNKCGTCGSNYYCSDCIDYWSCCGCYKRICYDCFMKYPYRCNWDHASFAQVYCSECVEEGNEVEKCDRCNECYCRGCLYSCYGEEEGVDVFTCKECRKGFCSKCDKENGLIDKCDYCDYYYCRGCYLQGVGVFTCDCEECDVKCCDDCRLRFFREGAEDCAECITQIAHLLVDESAVQKQLREENEQLKVENGKLKREIEEMKLELESERTRS